MVTVPPTLPVTETLNVVLWLKRALLKLKNSDEVGVAAVVVEGVTVVGIKAVVEYTGVVVADTV